MTWYSASTLTPTGGPVSPPAAGGVLQAGWIDEGGIWSINSSNQLVSGTSASGNPWTDSVLYAPASSISTDYNSRCTRTYAYTTGLNPYVMARYSPPGQSNKSYFTNVANGTINAFYFDGTTGGLGLQAINAAGNIVSGSTSVPGLTAGQILDSDIQVVQQNSTTTYVTATIYDHNSGNVLGTCTFSCALAGSANFNGVGGIFNAGTAALDTQIRTYIDTVAGATGYTATESASSGAPGTPITISFALVGGATTAAGTITPSDGSGGGTFSPTTVSVASGATTIASVTYTPAGAVGSRTISFTHTGLGFSGDPASLTFSVTTPPVVSLPNDPNIIFTPYQWDKSSAYAEAIYYGAAFRMTANFTSITFNLEQAGMVAGVYMVAFIDGVRIDHTVNSGDTTWTPASGLAAGDHEVEIVIDGPTNYSLDQWSGGQRFKMTSISFVGGTGTKACNRPESQYHHLHMGDSISAAHQALNNNISGGANTGRYGALSYVKMSSRSLGYECGNCSWPGGSFSQPDASGLPGAIISYQYYRNGVPKLVGGLFVPSPDLITTNLGTNGEASSWNSAGLQSFLETLRAAAPNANIGVFVPFLGASRALLTAGVASYHAAHPTDTKVKLMDSGIQGGAVSTPAGSIMSGDGTHPFAPGHGLAEAVFSEQVKNAFGYNGGSGGVGATSYQVLGYPTAPVIGLVYPVSIVLNGNATAGGSIVLPAVPNVAWNGGTAGVASSVPISGGSNAATFNVSYPGLTTTGTIALTHTGLGFSGADVTLPSVTPSPTSSFYTPQQIAAAILATVVPMTGNQANTVADAMNASRAQGFGKWQRVGNQFNIYGPDNTTIVKSFTLDDAFTPTTRT